MIYLFTACVFWSYGGVTRSGVDVASDIDTNGAQSRQTATGASSPLVDAQLAGASVGAAILVLGLFMMLVVYFTRLSRSVPIEYAYFILLLWVIMGTYTRNDCLCVHQSSDSGGTGPPPPPQHSSSILAGLDRVLRKTGICRGVGSIGTTIIVIVQNALYAAVITSLYVAHIRDTEFFSVFKSMRYQHYNQPIEDEETAADRAQFAMSIPIARASIAIVALLLAVIPLDCNNAQLVGYFEYGLRVVGFLVLFAFRMVNDYSRRLLLRNKARGFNLDAPDPSIYGDITAHLAIDVRQTRHDLTRSEAAKYERADARARRFDAILPPNAPEAPAIAEFRIDTFRRYIDNSVVFDVAVSIILASTTLILCTWFLAILAVQFTYEIYLQYATSSETARFVNNIAHTALALANGRSGIATTTPVPASSSSSSPVQAPSANGKFTRPASGNFLPPLVEAHYRRPSVRVPTPPSSSSSSSSSARLRGRKAAFSARGSSSSSKKSSSSSRQIKEDRRSGRHRHRHAKNSDSDESDDDDDEDPSSDDDSDCDNDEDVVRNGSSGYGTSHSNQFAPGPRRTVAIDRHSADSDNNDTSTDDGEDDDDILAISEAKDQEDEEDGDGV
jgi:hypothetical protein